MPRNSIDGLCYRITKNRPRTLAGRTQMCYVCLVSTDVRMKISGDFHCDVRMKISGDGSRRKKGVFQ